MEFWDVIKARRSIRKYADKPVSREQLTRICEAGRLAPSGVNRQDWLFIVVDDVSRKSEIAAACPNGGFSKDAGACIGVFIGPQGATKLEDASAATENMLLAVTDMGLGACWIGVYNRPYAPELERLMGAPEGYVIHTLFSVGHILETPAPAKKSLDEVMRFYGA